MILSTLCLLGLAVAAKAAKADDNANNLDNPTFSFSNSYKVITGSAATISAVTLTGSDYSYATITGQLTLNTSSTAFSNQTATSTGSGISQITRSATSATLFQITGGAASSSSSVNGTETSQTSIASTTTSSSAAPVNTLPCNLYPEFCNRKYSNITQVCAHNSAFVVPDNAASNQMLPTRTQLEDGVRMIQGEVHWVNGTMWNCHTSCDELNAGPWENTLVTIREFLDDNPYEVVTVLIVNSDFTNVENFVPAITNSGLMRYMYEPKYVPQYRDQWPTLGEMILKGQRVVFFMDYDADQAKVPYVMDEFTHMWETPFSPQDPAFPCTQQRPPGLNQTVARDQFMYLANHNLNQRIDLSSIGINFGQEVLVPNTAVLNITNGLANQFSRMGAMSLNCTADWGRPPNFLLVDYYNVGSPMAGSVFHVAAQANGVVDTRSCCGKEKSLAAPGARSSVVALVAAVAFAVSISC